MPILETIVQIIVLPLSGFAMWIYSELKDLRNEIKDFRKKVDVVPEKYVQKDDFQQSLNEIKSDIKEVLRRLEKKQDKE